MKFAIAVTAAKILQHGRTSQNAAKSESSRCRRHADGTKNQDKQKSRRFVARYKISRPVRNFVKFAIAAIAAKNLQPYLQCESKKVAP